MTVFSFTCDVHARSWSSPCRVQLVQDDHASDDVLRHSDHPSVFSWPSVCTMLVTALTQASVDGSPCKVNRMRFCHTDLGAVAYKWKRLVSEDLRFGELDAIGRFASQDALMTELVVDEGWRVEYLHGRCFFDAGPSPQMCARSGGAFNFWLLKYLSVAVSAMTDDPWVLWYFAMAVARHGCLIAIEHGL
jgi:hypothetical protein